MHRDSVLVSTAALPFDTSPAAMGNKYIHISNAVYARQYHGVDFDEAEFKFPLSELPQKLSTSPSGTSEIDLAVLFACICDVVRDLFEVGVTVQCFFALCVSLSVCLSFSLCL